MRLHIYSDGTPHGTKVYDGHANEISGIQSLVIKLDVNQPRGVVTMTVIDTGPREYELGELRFGA